MLPLEDCPQPSGREVSHKKGSMSIQVVKLMTVYKQGDPYYIGNECMGRYVGETKDGTTWICYHRQADLFDVMCKKLEEINNG